MKLSLHRFYFFDKNFHQKKSEKRSDIDERLLELASRIAQAKEYAKKPVGHGRFNFDEM
jgi:hypothetical protein